VESSRRMLSLATACSYLGGTSTCITRSSNFPSRHAAEAFW